MKEPAVIMEIEGGLGNQLFMYAFGRSLALRSGVPLVLDHLSGFVRDYYRRAYTLDRFKPCCRFSRSPIGQATVMGRALRRLSRWSNKALPLSSRSHVLEPNQFAYDSAIATMPIVRPTFFEGFWQHEQYFVEHRLTLLDELSLCSPPSVETREVADRIDACSAVCVHVRRLLGVPNRVGARPLPESPDIHLDQSYYDRAIAFIGAHLQRPRFFVFADYPDWARANLKIPFPTEYVVHNGARRDYEDLWLMSRCRAFVIANSTFSWWGAWLATHPDKLVVAPESGIGCGLKSIPAAWHRL